MMKKNIRRWLALIILIGLFSALAPLMKLLLVAPLTTLLLSDYDDFSLKERLKHENIQRV